MTEEVESIPPALEHRKLPPETAILIVASNASTKFGGEAVLPVHYFRLLKARGWRVKLIAHERNREDLTQAFGETCNGIVFVEDTVWHKLIWKAGMPFPSQIQQFLFGTLLGLLNEYYQARVIRRLVDAGQADLIHQPMPVSPRLPSSVHGFGVPVVIGPMNGNMKYPPGYEDFERRADRYFVPITRAFSRLANWAIPGKKRATVLLVANERTRAALPVDHDRVVIMVENGVDLNAFEPKRTVALSPRNTLRLVFMGRLVRWKAVDITLKAVAEARARGLDVKLDVLGDGFERASLEKLAEDLGLKDIASFYGFMPQAECARVLESSDALILNSVYECGGAVILEAMSIGLPVIASEWGGPADYVDASTGILVHPVPRESFASRLADAIQRLAEDPEMRRKMGAAGSQKIKEEYNWERKVDQILRIYAEALTFDRR